MNDAAPASLPRAELARVAGRPVLVGLSGGLDSTVLLHLLAEAPGIRAGGLRALHVHHGLHPEADDWAGHCQALCDGWGIALEIRRVHVDRAAGGGLEDAARTARHAAFAQALRVNEVLALAHHLGDQAETFLLRALRASGPEGLAAMRAWRGLGRGWCWRPLLDVPREALLAHARAHGLRWIDDPANLDAAQDRNYLRHHVMPALLARWPHAHAALARSAALSADAAALLDGEDALALAGCRTLDPATLAVEALAALPPARRARVLRRWIDALDMPPLPARGVHVVETTLLHADADATPCFAWSGHALQRWRGLLHAAPLRAPLPQDFHANWDGGAPLALPGGGSLRLLGADRLPAPVSVHARRGGERIVLPGRDHSHALKHVLQSLEVPPWIRARMPLVSDAGGQLLAAADLAYAAAFDAWLRAHGARLAWSD